MLDETRDIWFATVTTVVADTPTFLLQLLWSLLNDGWDFIKTTTTEQRLSLAIGSASAWHFVCVANFLPKSGASLKIQASVLACIATSFLLATCVFYSTWIDTAQWSLMVAFMSYEIAKWRDGVLICEHYSR